MLPRLIPVPVRAPRWLIAVGLLLLALGTQERRAPAAEESAAWKTYRDENCGLEVRYPSSYQIKASSPKDFCALSLSIEDLLYLDIDESVGAERPASFKSFALSRAMVRCTADGHDSSTYCTGTVKETSFRTAQGFIAHEFYLTEVHEEFGEPKKVETQTRGPIFAVDISDEETARAVFVTTDAASAVAARAVIDTLRVWTRARRTEPRIVEIGPFSRAPGVFSIRVVSDELPPQPGGPPRVMMDILVTDPLGHRRGRDPATQTLYAEAPAITGWTARESAVMLQSAVEGRYQIQIMSAVASARYRLVIHAPEQSGKQAMVEYAHRAGEPGSVDRFDVVYSKSASPPVKILPVKDVSRLMLLVTGLDPARSDIVVVDPRGRRTGLDPAAGASYREIPRSSYLEEGSVQRTVAVEIGQPIDGWYGLEVFGTGPGTYAFDVRGWDRNGDGTGRPHYRPIPTARGSVHRYRLQYSAAPNAQLTVRGGFEGAGQKPDDTDTFLTYANPTRLDTPLAPGDRTFPLLIFYGGSIQPVTFSAMRDDINISSRFTPRPGTAELVLIPLRAGSNALVLSVQGTTAAGQLATDIDRLTFQVP
jgi:hypothetical protein